MLSKKEIFEQLALIDLLYSDSIKRLELFEKDVKLCIIELLRDENGNGNS